VNWLVGQPFGSGFARTVEGTDFDSHPHNFYIETMIRAGLGGLIALIALTFGLLCRLWRVPVRGMGLFDPSILAPLLAMQLIWYLTWVPGLEQGIATGIAIAVAVTGAGRDPTGLLGWRDIHASKKRGYARATPVKHLLVHVGPQRQVTS
jgi:hypothetical protein